MVLLRRRPARRNFVRGIEVSGAPARPAGDHVRRLFSGYDVVRTFAEPADVLELAVALPTDATVNRQWVGARGRAWRGRARIDLRDGAGFSLSTTDRTAEVLQRCDGRATLGTLVAAVADEQGRPREELAAQIAPEATRLLGFGFLVAPGRRS